MDLIDRVSIVNVSRPIKMWLTMWLTVIIRRILQVVFSCGFAEVRLFRSPLFIETRTLWELLLLLFTSIFGHALFLTRIFWIATPYYFDTDFLEMPIKG